MMYKRQKRIIYGGQSENQFEKDTFDIIVAIRDNINETKVYDVNSFMPILKKLRTNKSKDFYFTLDDSKRTLFNNCVNKNESLKEIVQVANNNSSISKIRIKFTWKTLLLFGTVEQQNILNNFRFLYISHLLNNHCKNGCKFEVIGTIANSPQSDMDFDLTGSSIPKIITQIIKNHTQYFNEPLDVLFDINLYGSVFDSKIEKMDNTIYNQQKIWSFVRVIEVMSLLNKETQKRFYDSLNEIDKILYNDTLVFLNHFVNFKRCKNMSVRNKYLTIDCSKDMFVNNVNSSEFFYKNNSVVSNVKELIKRKSFTEYSQELSNYFREAKQDMSYFNIVNSFSFAKFQENETYRSLGAVLHIVQKQTSLIDKRYYIHSIYDNFGFVLENLLHDSLCGSIFKSNVLKVSKYISRIIDGIKLYNETLLNDFLVKLKNLSDDLNNARRGSNVQKLDSTYEQFIIFINNHNDKKRNLDGDNLEFAIYLYEKLLINL